MSQKQQKKVDSISRRCQDIQSFIEHTGTPRIIGNKIHHPKQHIDIEKFLRVTRSKLRYVSSGSGGHMFRCCSRFKSQNGRSRFFALKIVPFRKNDTYGSVHDPHRPENTEIDCCCVLSRFVMNRETPHVVCPVTCFNTSINSIRKLDLNLQHVYNRKKFEKFKDFLDRMDKPGYYHDTCSIMISEWANGGDLLSFLRDEYQNLTEMQWRVILFQVLHPLAVIQNENPGFRHNDLKANNILIHETPHKSKWNASVKYRIGNTRFIVPNIGIQLLMGDFDFANIPGVINNRKVRTDWCKKINITPEQNRYYDMHYFFYTLFHCYLKKFHDCSSVPMSVKNFIRDVIPEEARCNVLKRGRLKLKKEFMTPMQVLMENKYFAKFRRMPKERKKKLENTIALLPEPKIRLASPPQQNVSPTVRRRSDKHHSNRVLKKTEANDKYIPLLQSVSTSLS